MNVGDNVKTQDLTLLQISDSVKVMINHHLSQKFKQIQKG
jgi:hypothetical protein